MKLCRTGLILMLGVFSTAARAETLRFDCTREGIADKRTADLTAVISVEDSGVEEPTPVQGTLESVTLYQVKMISGINRVGIEKNLKLSGNYALFPREVPRKKKNARDFDAVVVGRGSSIRRVYLNTTPKVSYVETTKGDIFMMDCALDPM